MLFSIVCGEKLVFDLKTSSSLLSFVRSDALNQTGRRVNESTAQTSQRGFKMILRCGDVRRRSFASQKHDTETNRRRTRD